jgi:hypothetical protein
MIDFFPRFDFDNDTLVAHLRSEDVFGSGIRVWQPPCSFYLGAMNRHRKTIVISVDDANPCVKMLVNRGGIWMKQSLKTDFGMMLWARHFAMSASTFANAAILASPIPKNLYVLRMIRPLRIEDANLANVRHCRPSAHYQQLSQREFQCTPEHLEILLHDNCTWIS